MSYVLRFLAWLLPARICHLVFRALAWCLAKLPRNDYLWCYTIKAKDGKSPYITRCLFPRWRGARTMLHWIHIPDQDYEMHDHPWAWGFTRVLIGGYTEERAELSRDGLPYGRYNTWIRKPGQKPTIASTITKLDWHRIISVKQPTWTLFTVGDRVQNWGFLIEEDGKFIKEPWQDFFKRKGIAQDKVAS